MTKSEKVISHPTDNLSWGMKCFDPPYWSMWPTIFSFQWMQELLLRCPVRISMIGYVSVALTTAIWKPRYIYLFVFFPFFFEIFLVLPWFAVFPVLPLKLLPLPIIFPDLFKVLLLVLFAVPCIFRYLCWSHSVSNKPALKIKLIL